jgi:pyruvate,water dikinase
MNVDVWRAMADAIPGASGSALERDLLGDERPGAPTRARPGRYPAVMVRMPRAVHAARRRIVADVAPQRRQWAGAVASLGRADERAARETFAEAFRTYQEVAVPHLVATMAAQGLFDALKRVTGGIGRPGLESSLVTGLGTEEGEMLGRLWTLAHGHTTLPDFLCRYGYHGPSAGELANDSWRSDPALLDALLERYRSLPGVQAPTRMQQRQRAERVDAEATLTSALPRPARGPARLLLKLVHAYLPLRELGRASVLRTVDIARAAARAVGQRGADTGTLRRPDDVFMMTVAELSGAASAPGPDELTFRRERWLAYQALTVPPVWVGVPTPVVAPESRVWDQVRLSGIGASAGAVEGRVRLVHDPESGAELEPGEILVCHTTDPSWASLFLYASAVVIDIGGPISHGAIVAREMGIPCVINTKHGTERLRTGDLVRVDGRAGIVETLAATP